MIVTEVKSLLCPWQSVSDADLDKLRLRMRTVVRDHLVESGVPLGTINGNEPAVIGHTWEMEDHDLDDAEWGKGSVTWQTFSLLAVFRGDPAIDTDRARIEAVMATLPMADLPYTAWRYTVLPAAEV